jgi:hypothetical protein
MGRRSAVAVAAVLLAATTGAVAVGASLPAPPFATPVVVVEFSWDYDNVAVAYDVLPAEGAPYHPFDVSGGPSCMVPPVPYYLASQSGDDQVGPEGADGPGTGSYPDNPGANYSIWEGRDGPPGEYVIVIRWVNYCYRPDDVLPGPSEPPLPQEQAFPQGQPVPVTARVAWYTEGETAPARTASFSGEVIAGAERPANELAVELGRIELPARGAAPGEVTAAPATGEAPQATADEPAASTSGEGGGVPVATEPAGEGPDSGEPLSDEAQLDAMRIFVLILMLAVFIGLGAAIAVVLTHSRGGALRRWHRGWSTEYDDKHDYTPDRRTGPRVPGPPISPTNLVTDSTAFDASGMPYSTPVDGPVQVLEVKDQMARVLTEGRREVWVMTEDLGPLPPPGPGTPSA